ncbi:MAG: FeoA family protein [bacterium]
MITTLERLRNGRQGLVLEIRGGKALRQRLARLGVHPGDRVRVIRIGSFGGPVLIDIHGAEVAIGRGMAQKIELEVSEHA